MPRSPPQPTRFQLYEVVELRRFDTGLLTDLHEPRRLEEGTEATRSFPRAVALRLTR